MHLILEIVKLHERAERKEYIINTKEGENFKRTSYNLLSWKKLKELVPNNVRCFWKIKKDWLGLRKAIECTDLGSSDL